MTPRHAARRCPKSAWILVLALVLGVLAPAAPAVAAPGRECSKKDCPGWIDQPGWRWEAAASHGVGVVIPSGATPRLYTSTTPLSLGVRYQREHHRHRSFARGIINAFGSVFIGNEYGLEVSSRVLSDGIQSWYGAVLDPTLMVAIPTGRARMVRFPSSLGIGLPKAGVFMARDGTIAPLFEYGVPVSIRIHRHWAVEFELAATYLLYRDAPEQVTVGLSVGIRMLGGPNTRR